MKNHLRKIFHIVRDMYYDMCFALFFKRKNGKVLRAIANIYQGKRAFVVCNGPSLRAGDLDIIAQHNELSIASNRINEIFTQTIWRPDLYTVMDSGFQFSLLSSMNAVPAKYKFFKRESFRYTKKVVGNVLWLNPLYNDSFSTDISTCCYDLATVTFSMLQILYHLGIREIYIIGCDNSYGKEITKEGKEIIKSNQSSHFYKTIDETVSAKIFEMNHAYDIAKEFAAKNDLHIYNATRGGYLETFERVDFDTLF